MASQGARALFIPTNNGLPPEKAEVAAHARNVDIALAIENNISVIRADVAGRTHGKVSYGSSGIVDPYGNVLQSARELAEELIVADLDVSPPEPMAKR
jgi:predicted amidohydrolase